MKVLHITQASQKSFFRVHLFKHIWQQKHLSRVAERRTKVGGRAKRCLFTHCESTLDIPEMREDCQIHPDGTEAFPLWDQAWMRARCRGSKDRAGGGDNQTSDWTLSVSQSMAARPETLQNGFHRIKTSVPSLERGCCRQIWEEKKKRVTSSEPLFTDEQQNSYLDYVPVQMEMIRWGHRELISRHRFDMQNRSYRFMLTCCLFSCPVIDRMTETHRKMLVTVKTHTHQERQRNVDWSHSNW